jgi:myo-inositol-1(or 4)-monophosphatase
LLTVIDGSLDAYLSVDLPIWDTAAGHHLVQMSGGAVEHIIWHNTPVTLAGSPSAVDAIRTVIMDTSSTTGPPDIHK